MESLGCQDKDQPSGPTLENTSLENNNGAQVNEQTGVDENGTEVQVASGSPLPGVKVVHFGTLAVPEWFAAGAFGLVTVFTLLLRNVTALQSNLLSVFDNLDLLKDGLPGALITAFLLGVHEVSHCLVAKEVGVKLGIPYFVPSWQIGSFGAITRILNIVPKREDLLKVAAAGPLAGFSVGLILLLSGFILPPTDGIGIILDPSVFHESFLAGGIGKY
ncbi:hypothetical protein K7X08_020308 [Anisodus acutangulus]|uniref:Peptidase M50 domain-containing protein n=1 Tax=Anisodus acutangulus TaxID=402998 RepID=A0A9Q1M669_9SOLA|nr:hypothetical protein K7X08_020308 [Anisodus acutangulus]